MFIRYKTDEKGNNQPVAKVYTAKEHNIHNSQIDKDALWAIRRIQGAGEKAYLVGGAVRDMLLGRSPKDFDIATSASPRQIQRLFWNSRIIGRRFRIVHLFFGNNKILEVTTFRSDEEDFEDGNNNIFGTIEQDSRRRDFSMNALYYNPVDQHLLDFCGGIEDIKKGVIRSLIPLSYSFKEDPVRMVRAVKYKCTTGFRFKLDVAWALRRNASNLEGVSTSRMTDEVFKILNTGCSDMIFHELRKRKMLGHILPCLEVYIDFEKERESLRELDQKVQEAKKENKEVSQAEMIYYLVRPVITLQGPGYEGEDNYKEAFRQIKVILAPMTPPNYEIERAVELILENLGLKTKHRRKKDLKKTKPVPAKDKSAKKVHRKRKKPSNASETAAVSTDTPAEEVHKQIASAEAAEV